VRVWLRQHRQAFLSALRRLGMLNALVIGVALSLPAGGYALLESLRSVAARLTFEPQITVFLAPGAKRADTDALGAATRASGSCASCRETRR
jgi:cell division transport system permease protein